MALKQKQTKEVVLFIFSNQKGNLSAPDTDTEDQAGSGVSRYYQVPVRVRATVCGLEGLPELGMDEQRWPSHQEW